MRYSNLLFNMDSILSNEVEIFIFHDISRVAKPRMKYIYFSLPG